MSDHLPECIYAPRNVDPKKGIEWGGQPCICPALRACEQRVREEIDREAFVLDDGDPFRQAYRKGLDAARETVTDAGICTCTGSAWHGHDGSDDRCPVPTVLAAIDALRGER